MNLYKSVNPNNNVIETQHMIEHPVNSHLQTKFMKPLNSQGMDRDVGDFEGITEDEEIKLGLFGMVDRAFMSIFNLIQSGKLLELGNKLNNMLEDEDAKRKNYGRAGLEGVYINENILGLLEVLSQKIQENRSLEKGTNVKNFVHVVCKQKEIYKDLLNVKDESGKYQKIPIGFKLLEKLGRIESVGIIKKFKQDAPVFVEDDELFSQLFFLRKFMSIKNGFYKSTKLDNFDNKMRSDGSFEFNNKLKGISTNIENNEENWINNYNYNKIFNISNPPIKSILKPYLDDDSFKNFYLFFVVSNNLKVTKNAKGQVVGDPLETCDKQLQLLYDTRDFMDVIAHEDAEGIKNCDV
jgi:hypothetical protein